MHAKCSKSGIRAYIYYGARKATCSILELVQKEGNRMVHDERVYRRLYQRPRQKVVRLQPHGDDNRRTVAENMIVFCIFSKKLARFLAYMHCL